jgi:hypothetical protein
VTPSERTLRSRIGGYVRASRYDGREMTAAARRTFLDSFERQVDPDGLLPPAERARRAEAARRAHMTALSLKAAQARRRAKENRP